MKSGTNHDPFNIIFVLSGEERVAGFGEDGNDCGPDRKKMESPTALRAERIAYAGCVIQTWSSPVEQKSTRLSPCVGYAALSCLCFVLHRSEDSSEYEASAMPGTKKQFDLALYMASSMPSHKRMRVCANESFYSQGDEADSIYYLVAGRARLIVVSKRGKEATVSLINAHDFIGEESLTGPAGFHSATAVAITACTVVKLERNEMIRLLNQENGFSDMFLKFVLLRAVRTQEDLIDQLFNNSEKRLARTLLLMAQFGDPGESRTILPPITQGALAEMIGTTRSRVSHFMNRFRQLGYIEYNGRIHVHKSLLNVVLHDQLPDQRITRPVLLDPSRTPSEIKKAARLI